MRAPLAARGRTSRSVHADGLDRVDKLLEKGEDEEADSGFFGLSVFCAIKNEGQTTDEVLAWLMPQLPVAGNRWAWVSTVQQVEEGGMALHETPPRPFHYVVALTARNHAGVRDFVRVFEKRRAPR